MVFPVHTFWSCGVPRQNQSTKSETLLTLCVQTQPQRLEGSQIEPWRPEQEVLPSSTQRPACPASYAKSEPGPVLSSLQI
jgi:hypothetical protein